MHRSVVITCAAIAALFLASACKKKEAGGLDGKTFSIQVTEPGKPPQPDTLIFAGGTLDSPECRKWGFDKTPYTAKAEGGATTFRSEAKSAKEGTNTWSGKVEGNRVSGTLVWAKPSQAAITYTYTGTLAAK